MQNVLLVAYLLIVLALIAVILLQRSEGGGLGMGGNAGGLMTVRGSANLLTRTTAVLAALFFATAIGLTILSELDRGTDSILDQATGNGGNQPSTVFDALSQMQGADTSSSTPATASASSAAPTDPGLALPVTPAPSAPAAPASSAAAAASSSAAPATSSEAAASSAPAASSSAAAPASSSAPAQ
jgi:preprotein translocase subunit SecG